MILDELLPVEPTVLEPVGQAVAEGEGVHSARGLGIGEGDLDLIGGLRGHFPRRFPRESMGLHGMVLAGPGVMVVRPGNVVVAHQGKEQRAARPHFAGVPCDHRLVVVQCLHESVAGNGLLIPDQPASEFRQDLGHGSGLVPDFYARCR